MTTIGTALLLFGLAYDRDNFGRVALLGLGSIVMLIGSPGLLRIQRQS